MEHVVVGTTYRVQVPHSLPAGRYPIMDVRRAAANVEDLRLSMRWHRLRGAQFELTVVDLDPEATPPTVHGVRMVTTSSVVLPLSLEQVAELGLEPGAYEISGYVRRLGARGGVEVPEVDELTVPVWWLRSLDSPPSRSHRDLTGREW